MTESTLTAASGVPVYWAEFNDTIYLGPIPSEAKTVKIWGYKLPSEPSAGSAIEVPDRYDQDLVNYLLMMKALKDKNTELASHYRKAWKEAIEQAIEDEHFAHNRGDLFTVVNEDMGIE